MVLEHEIMYGKTMEISQEALGHDFVIPFGKVASVAGASERGRHELHMRCAALPCVVGCRARTCSVGQRKPKLSRPGCVMVACCILPVVACHGRSLAFALLYVARRIVSVATVPVACRSIMQDAATCRQKWSGSARK